MTRSVVTFQPPNDSKIGRPPRVPSKEPTLCLYLFTDK